MLFYLEHKTPAVHIKVKYDTIGVMPKTWPIQVGGGTKRLTPHLSCYSWYWGSWQYQSSLLKNSFVQDKLKLTTHCILQILLDSVLAFAVHKQTTNVLKLKKIFTNTS